MESFIVRATASLCLCMVGMAVALPAAGPRDACFKSLPAGTFLDRSVELSREQLAAIGKKLGAAVESGSNNYLRVQGYAIQVNLLDGPSEADAKAVFQAIARTKGHPAFCLRSGHRVVEYVGKDPALAVKTSYELGFAAKPKEIVYRVRADVAMVDRADYMACNDLFNLFLAGGKEAADLAPPAKIAALARRFRFGSSIALRDPGGPARGVYAFDPQPRGKPEANQRGGVTYVFDKPATRFDVPYATLTAVIHAGRGGFTPATRRPDGALTSATARWPADDPQVVALARQITSGAEEPEAKVQAVLAWLAPGKNVKFGGPVTGSRWGVKNVLKQRYGQCWDFSDCFVTLCRASGVPCRQVAGWLYGASGHVWAEVLVPGKGWQQVDPTGGGKLPCGIYHLPYFTTEDGEMPIVYLAMPKIEIVTTK